MQDLYHSFSACCSHLLSSWCVQQWFGPLRVLPVGFGWEAYRRNRTPPWGYSAGAVLGSRGADSGDSPRGSEGGHSTGTQYFVGFSKGDSVGSFAGVSRDSKEVILYSLGFVRVFCRAPSTGDFQLVSRRARLQAQKSCLPTNNTARCLLATAATTDWTSLQDQLTGRSTEKKGGRAADDAFVPLETGKHIQCRCW